MLTDTKIEKILENNRKNINRAAGLLIEEANTKGGGDNISLVLVKYEKFTKSENMG
jgi:protein phosphatase